MNDVKIIYREEFPEFPIVTYKRLSKDPSEFYPLVINGIETSYEIDYTGRIKGKKQNISPYVVSDGYEKVRFRFKDKYKREYDIRCYLDQIVASVFCSFPKDVYDINSYTDRYVELVPAHIDGNKLNSSPDNLIWVDPKNVSNEIINKIIESTKNDSKCEDKLSEKILKTNEFFDITNDYLQKISNGNYIATSNLAKDIYSDIISKLYSI